MIQTLKTNFKEPRRVFSLSLMLALCLISLAAQVSAFWETYWFGKTSHSLIAMAVAQGIFLSASFVFQSRYTKLSFSRFTFLHVISLLLLSSVWAVSAPLDAVEMSLGILGVFISPVSALGSLNLTTLGSLVFFLLLFLGGCSQERRFPSVDENAESIFFIYSLQKRMIQSICIVLLSFIIGWILYHIFQDIFRFDWRVIRKGVHCAFLFATEIFCPLYVVLNVLQDQAEFAQNLKGPLVFSYGKPGMLFISILILVWSALCLHQILTLLLHGDPFWNNPIWAVFIGLLGTYIYLFTSGVTLSSQCFVAKLITAFRTLAPLAYLPVWGPGAIRILRFLRSSVPTPVQLWICLLLLALGLFFFLLLCRHRFKIQYFFQGAIALCLVGLVGAKPLSLGYCKHFMNRFLERSGALSKTEAGTMILQPIPYPERSSVRDLKRLNRALNILQELAPHRLEALLSPTLKLASDANCNPAFQRAYSLLATKWAAKEAKNRDKVMALLNFLIPEEKSKKKEITFVYKTPVGRGLSNAW